MPKIIPEIDEAKTILETAAVHTGWNVESMLDVVCDYINERHGTEELLKYVQRLVDDELE